VGRAGELATAAFARDTARTGTGSVLVVTGVAGSGKTWLCESIAESATDEGFQVGWGSGWSGGGIPDLWPWQQAVGSLGDRSSTRELFAASPDLDDAEWFARCVAVVDHLRQLTAAQPTVLVIDDAHQADEATRSLAAFVARHVRGLPLVLVVAHQPAEGLAGLGRAAAPIELHGLGPADSAALLAARGVDALAPSDLSFVVAATGGLPGLLHGLANAATTAAEVVEALVQRQLADVPAEMVRAAAWAAVADASPRLTEVVALAADSGIDPLAVAGELERRGLVRRQPPDGWTFGHEQVRTALMAKLGVGEELDIHARVARVLADQPPSLDRLQRRAEHALAAAPRSADDARLAVEVVEDVAAALLGENQAERAAELLAAADKAHEEAGLGPPPAALLAARGWALQRCGYLASARDQFRRAATSAEKEGDATSLARAALGLGGVWLAEERSPLDRQRYLGLLARARDSLPDDEGSRRLRLRLGVRLAAEQAYEGGRYDDIEAQVSAARELDDPLVLAEALSLYHHSMLGPAHRELRAAIAEEMVAVTARANDHAASLMALLWLTTDQFLAGSSQAERSLRELHERAEALSGRHAAYIARVMDVMVLQREGRLAEAEQAAEVAFVVGMEVGDADALGYYGGQLVALRWIQGRSAEVLDLATQTEASPTITPLNQAFTASFAALAATCGELDRARAALGRLKGRLHSIHQSSAWLVTLFSTVEAAYLLGEVEIATEAAALMAPYADLPVLGSLAVSCVGSVRRSLGLAAVTAGELDRGIALLEEAVAHNEQLGNRPLAAMTTVELAMARSARGDPGRGDSAAAVRLLDQAIRQADAMDLTIRADEWRERRSAVAAGAVAAAGGGPAAGAGAGPAAALGLGAAALDHEVGTIGRRGRSWVLGVAGIEVVVPDLLGMTYLVQLLTNPGVEIAATELVAEGGEGAVIALAARNSAEQPVLDNTALAAYRRRVAELEDDLAEAERYADSERAARVRIELDAVVDELTRTTNRFGRARQFGSSNERARTAAQKAVRRTLDQIEKADSTLGTVLRRSIRTGRACCYEPGPGAPTRWIRSG